MSSISKDVKSRDFNYGKEKVKQMKIWFDIGNTPRVHFFAPIVKFIIKMDYPVFITSRNLGETKYLLNMYGFNHKVVGKYYEKPIIKKLYGKIKRVFSLYQFVSDFDIAIGSAEATQVAKLKFRKSIMFDDNELSSLTNRLYIGFADYIILPNAIPKETFIKNVAKQKKIRQYNGFKEDVYIADFKHDPNFLDKVPFKDDFITIRPEALQAIYVREKKSLVPDLIRAFNKENVNILYLPRHKDDRNYVREIRDANIFIPNEPLNGLDICWHSKAVLTGSGTFAREAACVGIPAVSFYPGDRLLSVDKKMTELRWLFHSREPEEIVNYVLSSKRRKPNLERSKKVQKEVFDIIMNIFGEIEERMIV